MVGGPANTVPKIKARLAALVAREIPHMDDEEYMFITSLFMTAPDFSALLPLMLIKSIHKLFSVQQILLTPHFSLADFPKLCQISFPNALKASLIPVYFKRQVVQQKDQD